MAWKIKVSASDWAITNFSITDYLPEVLEYSSYTLTHIPSGIVVSSPTTSWQTVAWQVKWTLNVWDYVELRLTTKATAIPKKDYKNVACVEPEDTSIEKKCDDENIPMAKVRIKKSFTDGTKTGKVLAIGDELAYRVSFWNNGTADAYITTLKDFLPKNVQYVSSAIYINGQFIHLNGTWSEAINNNTSVDGVYIDIYTWIRLKPWDTWYIILTWKVLSTNTWSRTNFACIYLNWEKIDCDDASHELTEKIICTKPEIKNTSFWNWWWSTTAVCRTSPLGKKANSIELDCGNWTIFTWSNISELSWTCTYPANNSSTKKTYTVQCKVNNETMDICKAPITVDGRWYSSCFVAWTQVIMADGSEKKIEDIETWEKVLWANGSINTVLWFHTPFLWEKELWSINWWEYFVTAEHPFMTTQWWKSLNPELSMQWTDIQIGLLNIWDVLITDNWHMIVKSLDSKKFATNTQLYNLKLDWDHTYHANGYLVHNKWWWGRRPVAEILDVNCFNVNAGNVSIEQWEILPFYLNIYKLKNYEKDWKYEEVKWYGFGDWDIFDNMKWKSCNTKENIALNSMVCEYKITDGNDKVVNKGTYPCLDKDWENRNMINAWIWWQENAYNHGNSMQSYRPWWNWTNYTFRSNIIAIPNFGLNNASLWEYKVSLTSIKYLYCNENYKWTETTMDKVVCESNFTLTNWYTVQKTPSGNFTKTSTEKLKDYLYMDWKSVMKMSSLLSAIADASQYQPNDKVKTAMTSFINKYEKLAIKVKTDKFWNSAIIRKVPSKDIYFIEWDATFVSNKKTITKPFTIIQTKGNITIKWSMNHNMMLLTQWSITFEDPNSCTQRQTVKWIFYAAWGLNRMPVKRNNNINNNYWCTEWWLTVKWILIWNWLNDLMRNSRSNLNNWFETTDKRSIVMNGASVLIEYSPSVFTKWSMPPGAEDFTTALSVYKY